MNQFYRSLAPWWPLLSPVEEYAEESGLYWALIRARRPQARQLLELGSGGGHVAYHLRRHLECTLTDLSPEMLANNQRLNPGCVHHVGDMRSLELGRLFDVVFVHDAIDYMTTEADLAAVFATASRHLGLGGLAVFVPDHVAERYEAGTCWGGSDAPDGRGARFLEWSEAAEPPRCTVLTHYSFLLRQADGQVEHCYERHELGLFPEATWVRLLQAAGFTVEVVEEETDEARTPRLFFLGHKAERG